MLCKFYFRMEGHDKSVFSYMTDHIYAMMKYFYHDGNGLFQDDSSPIPRALWLT